MHYLLPTEGSKGGQRQNDGGNTGTWEVQKCLDNMGKAIEITRQTEVTSRQQQCNPTLGTISFGRGKIR